MSAYLALLAHLLVRMHGRLMHAKATVHSFRVLMLQQAVTHPCPQLWQEPPKQNIVMSLIPWSVTRCPGGRSAGAPGHCRAWWCT
jgi:hypothetical protein